MMTPHTRPGTTPSDTVRARLPADAPADAVLGWDRLSIDGVSCHRTHAEQVVCLSIGRERTSTGEPPGLELLGRMPLERIVRASSSIVSLDIRKLSAADIAGPVRAIFPVGGMPVPIRLTAEAVSQQLQGDGLKLVRLRIDAPDVVDVINDSRHERHQLIAWGDAARVVHDVVLVMETELARTFDGHAPVELSAGVDGMPEASVPGGRSGRNRTTVRVEPGVCLAYRLCRLAWETAAIGRVGMPSRLQDIRCN